MDRGRRFCLVTSAHITNNPRLVKEADALRDVGADVRIVSLAVSSELVEQDEDLARTHGWRVQHVDGERNGANHGRWLWRATMQTAARRVFRSGLRPTGVAEYAASRMLPELARAVRAQGADVVVAHTLEALPAAGRAARVLGARLGFDAEDLHAEEYSEHQGAAQRRALATRIEARWLPRCDYVTASAPGIASELQSRYGIVRPHVVLNTFPQALRDRRILHADRTSAAPSLYWYSQTIGTDRGIEAALAALGGLPWPIALHLRGRIDDEYRRALLAMATSLNVAGEVHFHPPAPAEDLVVLASQHDVGLAAEQPVCLNRLVCMTNKLFTYLLAGVAVAATATPGQREILSSAPSAGFLYEHGDVDGLRAGLWSLFASPARLARAKASALAAALERYSWEHEAPGLAAYLTGARGRVRVGRSR